MKSEIATQTEALTFKKVERSIRRNKNIDSSIIDLLDELHGFMGNDNWREIPVYETKAYKFIELFVVQRIVNGDCNTPFKKVDALLFVIDKINEIQLKHGKDPVLQPIRKGLCEIDFQN